MTIIIIISLIGNLALAGAIFYGLREVSNKLKIKLVVRTIVKADKVQVDKADSVNSIGLQLEDSDGGSISNCVVTMKSPLVKQSKHAKTN